MLAMVANIASSLPMLAQHWQTNQSLEMIGKRLGSQCCISNLMQMLGQCWKCHHKLTFSQNAWWTVGKWLASQHHIANLMPCWANVGILTIYCSTPRLVCIWLEIGQIANIYNTDVGPMVAWKPIANLTVYFLLILINLLSNWEQKLRGGMIQQWKIMTIHWELYFAWRWILHEFRMNKKPNDIETFSAFKTLEKSYLFILE